MKQLRRENAQKKPKQNLKARKQPFRPRKEKQKEIVNTLEL